MERRSGRAGDTLKRGRFPLRVGVVAQLPHPHMGGGFTILSTLLAAMDELETDHTFVRLDIGSTPLSSEQTVKGISAADRFLGFVKHARRNWIPNWLWKAISVPARKIFPRRDWVDDLNEIISAERIDVVWFMNPPGAVVSVPFIATVWDLAHRNMPYFPEVSIEGWTWTSRENAYRTVLPRASFVITGTQFGKSEIVRYYGINPENVRVIAFPVPSIESGNAVLNRKTFLEKHSLTEPFLFYPAQFWPHKNHVNLLLALKVLQEKHDLVLDMVCTGRDKGNTSHVQSVAKKLGLSQQFHVLGFVERSDLEALYSHAGALVFPSFFGPDNLPPLEAFALQCPVVAARVNGANEQLGDGALLFDPTDPEEIADAIYAVVTDPQLSQKLQENGESIAAERTVASYVAQIESVVDEFQKIRRCWGQDYKYT